MEHHRTTRRVGGPIVATMAAIACLLGTVASAAATPALRPGAPARAVVTSTAGDVSFVEQAYHDFLGRTPSAQERADAVAALTGGEVDRPTFLLGLANSPEWLGHVVTGFYLGTLGRAPDTAGLAYWVGIVRNHTLTVAQVAAAFYSSPEYYTGVGGNDAAWVGDLYRALLHRSADSAGLAYWVGITRTQGRWVTAFAFYQSLESRVDRVGSLYDQLLHRSPDPAGLRYWAELILTRGDVTLAMDLAASREYYVDASRWSVLTTGDVPRPWVPVAVDNSGTVVGHDAGGAFTCTDPCTSHTPLTQPPGGGAEPLSGSPSGAVLGHRTVLDGYVAVGEQAVVWPTSTGTPIVLAPPVGLAYTHVIGVADDGSAIGSAQSSGQGPAYYRWATLASQPVALHLDVPAGYSGVRPMGVGPDGTIWGAGLSTATQDWVQDLMWDPLTGAATVVQAPDGFSGVRVTGISSGSELLGVALGGAAPQPFVSALDGSTRTLLDLPDAPDEVVSVDGITADGLVFGRSYDGTSGHDENVVTWAGVDLPAVTSDVPGGDTQPLDVRPEDQVTQMAGVTPAHSIYLNGPYLASTPTGAAAVTDTLGVRFASPGAPPSWTTAQAAPRYVLVTGANDEGVAYGTAGWSYVASVGVVWTDPSAPGTVLRNSDRYVRVAIDGVSDQGLVVGTGYAATTDHQGGATSARAVKWTSLDVDPVELGLPEGATSSGAADVSHDGSVVGWVGGGGMGKGRGTFWSASGEPTLLAAPAGAVSYVAQRIGPSGAIYGTFVTSDHHLHAVMWTGPSAEATSLPDPSGGIETVVGATSDGTVVGTNAGLGSSFVWATPSSDPVAVHVLPEHDDTVVADLAADGAMVGGDQFWSSPAAGPSALPGGPASFDARGVSSSLAVFGNAPDGPWAFRP